MIKLKLVKNNKLLAVLLSVLLVSLSGCGEHREDDKLTGYTVRLSDGWVSTVFYCESYKRIDRHIKCFDKNNKLVREDFMPNDVRITVKAN